MRTDSKEIYIKVYSIHNFFFICCPKVLLKRVLLLRVSFSFQKLLLLFFLFFFGIVKVYCLHVRISVLERNSKTSKPWRWWLLLCRCCQDAARREKRLKQQNKTVGTSAKDGLREIRKVELHRSDRNQLNQFRSDRSWNFFFFASPPQWIEDYQNPRVPFSKNCLSVFHRFIGGKETAIKREKMKQFGNGQHWQITLKRNRKCWIVTKILCRAEREDGLKRGVVG